MINTSKAFNLNRTQHSINRNLIHSRFNSNLNPKHLKYGTQLDRAIPHQLDRVT